MSREKTGLGKGLGALIPSASTPKSTEGSYYAETTGYQEVPIGSISVNPYQPRDVFNEDALNSLSLSIREVGVLQPVLIRRKTSDTFELIAGERRWRAAKRAGMETIPAIVRDVEDLTSLEHALVENLHRQDLGPLEEAAAYQQLIDDFQLSQESVAKRVGKSRPTIANALRLLQLPSSVQGFLMDGRLTAGHARALLGLPSRQEQDQLANRIIEENLTVREIEKIVRDGTLATKGTKRRPANKSVAELEVERILSELLSTRVGVKIGSRRGKITIDFANSDDLSRILEIIEGPKSQQNTGL